MAHTRVKICGLTDPTEARHIAELGADAIGLVFADSSRKVDPRQARQVTAALPAFVTVVGVFVDTSPEEINHIAEDVGLDLIQLHGRESPDMAASLNRPCIKAIRVRDASFVETVSQWVEPAAAQGYVRGILLDAYDPRARGGTGRTFNWQLLNDARRDGRLGADVPVILAGGLGPGNAADAIHAVHPYGLDVSSGVESSPGRKDLAAVEAFLAAVRQADGIP